jgi:hypothetical protein
MVVILPFVVIVAFLPVALQTSVNQVREIYRSAQSASGDSLRRIVRTGAEWKAAWKQVATDRASESPKVDFQREMLVVAGMGERNTGGYGIEVVSWEARGGELIVTVRETSPGPGCMLPQIITTPVLIVAIPKSDLPVKFIEKRETRDCK